MLTSPQLQQMSVDDLNTRYANSFVFYDGKVRLLQQFYIGGLFKYVIFYDSPRDFSDNGAEGVVFNASLLDIRRFPSMWVIAKDSFFWIQQNPTPSERYTRGIRDDTYHFWNVSFSRLRYIDKVKILEACYQAMNKWEAQSFDPVDASLFMSPKEGKRNIHAPMRNVLLIKTSNSPTQIYLQAKNVAFGTPLYSRIENECIRR